MDIIKYGSYYTWKDKQGKYNTQCNRACDSNKYSLTIPALPGLTKVLIEGGENMSNLRVRRLTPLETWRIMGFDDEDYYKAAEVNSDTQLYKQAGNSIVVDVLYYILKELFEEEI